MSCALNKPVTAIVIGRASVPSDSEHSVSHEIIDVDAEHIPTGDLDRHASTDDLDLIADPPPRTSMYFGQAHGLCKDGSEGPIAGPSLIGDGENTRLLQVRYGEAVLDRRSSSPIETFPEDAGEGKSMFETTKPRSQVKEQVAIFEARTRELDPPIIDLRKQSLKSRMQPKGGNAVVCL